MAEDHTVPTGDADQLSHKDMMWALENEISLVSKAMELRIREFTRIANDYTTGKSNWEETAKRWDNTMTGGVKRYRVSVTQGTKRMRRSWLKWMHCRRGMQIDSRRAPKDGSRFHASRARHVRIAIVAVVVTLPV